MTGAPLEESGDDEPTSAISRTLPAGRYTIALLHTSCPSPATFPALEVAGLVRGTSTFEIPADASATG